jgi:hypothetical protein
MKKVIALILFAVPVMAWGGPFDGTWVLDVTSSKTEGRPDTYLLQDGQFTCDACQPEVKIPADGKTHKLTGHSYYDEMTVTVVSPQSVKMSTTLNGKKNYDRTMTVAKDGKSMVEDFLDYGGSKPASAKFASIRVKSGPAGAHVISGSWRPDEKNTTMSADLTTVTFQESADGLKMSAPTGQSYDAKYDGKEYLTAGDPGKTMISLQHLGPRKILETDKRNGKVVGSYIMQVSDDGQTIHAVGDDKENGIQTTSTFKKKS